MPKRSAKAYIMRAYIWFYRMLFITFGGIAMDSNENLYFNKYLKYFGYFGGIIATMTTIFGFIYVRNSPHMTSIYNLGLFLTYYMIALVSALQIMHNFANLWYLNRNGLKLWQTLYRKEVHINKNQIIVSIIWICHLLLPYITTAYTLIFTEIIQTNSILFVFLVLSFRVYSFYTLWILPFMTWIIAFHFYGLLSGIRHSLIQLTLINKNRGKVI